MNRLLITGAAGHLGGVARHHLADLADNLRLADIAAADDPAPHEEIVTGDLADADHVNRIVAGCDAILHLGGVADEQPWAKIRDANIEGVFNLYEAARRHGRPRIAFASSNHVIGFYEQTARLTPDDPVRPDTLYGVSKCFGEALASLYFHKHGQETALIRIGACFDRPDNREMLSNWLSPADFASLVRRVFAVPRLGCPVVWGVSANDRAWWDNSTNGYLGYRPKDNAEAFADAIEADTPPPAPQDTRARYQGGAFCDEPIGGSQSW